MFSRDVVEQFLGRGKPEAINQKGFAATKADLQDIVLQLYFVNDIVFNQEYFRLHFEGRFAE